MAIINNIQNNELGSSVRLKLNTIITLLNQIAESDANFNVQNLKQALIKAINPSGKYLRDDGTWQVVTGTSEVDIADGSVTAAKLNNMGASANQVLGYNGTAWSPKTVEATDLTPYYTKTEIDLKLQKADEFVLEVDSFADLPTTRYANGTAVKTGDIALVKRSTTAILFADRKPNGVYMFNGTAWELTADYNLLINELLARVSKLTTIVENNILVMGADGGLKDSGKTLADFKPNTMTWIDYETQYTQTRNSIVTQPDFQIYEYQKKGINIYRRVPIPFTKAGDAFYSDISSAKNGLSDYLATREGE